MERSIARRVRISCTRVACSAAARPAIAKLTKAFRLPARFVIHTVGPVWQGGACNEPELLASCYRRSIEVAASHGIETIAFPCISTGVYRYPIEDAAGVAIASVRLALYGFPAIREIIFCCHSAGDLGIYERILADHQN